MVAASLHQAIADELPARLEFYESWLKPESLREGRLGVAPFGAALSFLRSEGGAYDRIVERAGTYAADWTVLGLPALQRGLLHRAPSWVRRRLVLDVAHDLVRRSFPEARAGGRWRKGVGQIEIRGSVFCGVRQAAPGPLCGFYAATVKSLLTAFGLAVEVRVDRCRAVDRNRTCLMTLKLDD